MSPEPPRVRQEVSEPARRVKVRVIFLAAAVGGTAVGALAVGWAGLAVLSDRAHYLLPFRPAEDLIEHVGAAMVLAGLVGLAASLVAAGLLSRLLTASLERLRRGIRADPYQSIGLFRGSRLIEISQLGQGLADRLAAEGEQTDRLERERAELAALLDSVGEGILRVSGGRIERANPMARDLLGLPAEGGPFSAVIRDADLRSVLEAADASRRESKEIDSGDRRLLAVAHPLGIGQGGVVSLMDLTELRRLESVRRDFVANASHELKTPLTSIRGYAETLISEEVAPDLRRQFLATIRDNSERLQRLVDDLLDLSRLETGGWRPEPDWIMVSAAARQVWGELGERARDAGVELVVEESSERNIRADPIAFRRILSNLFDNAIRHAPEGGRVRIRVSGARPDRVAIEVSDDGSGIPADALPRIFERFYRVDPARSRAEGGTGLGLAIVKHMVESMGGKVEAESRLGRGTTVRILLPDPPAA